jgi:hypothetical protein
MTDAVPSRPRVPWLTLVVQLMGVVGIVVGIRNIVDPGRCEGVCASQVFGVLATIWGVIALASGLRGRPGFVALMVAIVAPLTVSWLKFSLGMAFILVLFVATSASKTQLAPYYRWQKEATP